MARYVLRKYTYRMVLIPETIGSLTYLSRNLEVLRENVIAGFNVSCVGDDRAYGYVATPYGDTLAGPSQREDEGHVGGVPPGHAGRPSGFHAHLLRHGTLADAKGKRALRPSPVAMPRLTPQRLVEIERDLSDPPFRGVPLGSSLAALLGIELYGGHGDWGVRQRLKNWARFYYHRFRPLWKPQTDIPPCRNRVLVTWFEPNFRCRDLVLPVARHLGYDRCVVMYRHAEMASLLPADARAWRCSSHAL